MAEIQIPREVVEAFERNIVRSDLDAEGLLSLILKAWPGNRMETEYFTHCGDYWEPAVILPLPQESGDE